MRNAITNGRTLVLASREAVTLPRCPSGTWLVCVRGHLWVTEPGDRLDYLLGEGDRRFLPSRPGIVVSAIGPAEAELVPARGPVAVFGQAASACADC